MMGSATRIDQARRLGSRARIVQHATLRTSDAQEQAALRFALEDALATADFGDCGRLVLVRRLQLHNLPRGAGPVRVARALEIAWRTLATDALPHDHPQAAQAQAVFFASRFEARLAWLHSVARDRPTQAWFWPAALPELAPGLPPRAQVCDVVKLLLQEAPEPARQALLGWRDPELVTLAQAMSPSTLNAWRHLLVAAPAGKLLPATRKTPPSHAPSHAAMPLLATALRLIHAAPGSPEAAAWLAALWLVPALGRQPAPAEVQQVLSIATSQPNRRPSQPRTTKEAGTPVTAAHPTLPWTEPAPPPSGEAAAQTTAGDAPDVPALKAPVQVVQPATSTPANVAHSRDQPRADPPFQPAHPVPECTRRARATSALPWLADAQPSAHAGLLLLLNLLCVLRFDPWLQAQPVELRQPFVQTLLTHALDQSGAPAHDPQRAWLACTPADNITWQAGRLDGGRCSLPAALRLWQVRLRRVLRQHARLDLAEVVQRTGWVSASATHLDVLYPLDEVDLRLRRLGLDSDPGWVSWFGRIVAFHFVSRERLPTPDEGGARG